MGDLLAKRFCDPKEISAKLGFSTVVFSSTSPVGEGEIRMIGEAGIKRVEICGLRPRSHYDYRNGRQIEEIKEACRRHGVSIVSMHGPKVLYSTDHELVRKASVEEAVFSAKIAEEFGAEVFVAHFGIDDYSEQTVREMLESLDGTSIKLAVENGESLPDFMEFVDRIGSERFGMAVDIGHARDEDGVNPFVKKEKARQTLAQCGSRLIHLHLHDFIDRDHYAPLTGKIEWDEVFAALGDIGYEGELMFEAAYPSLEEVLCETARFPAAFVERYC